MPLWRRLPKTVFEIVDWNTKIRSVGLYSTEPKAEHEVERLIEAGVLVRPLYSIVERTLDGGDLDVRRW